MRNPLFIKWALPLCLLFYCPYFIITLYSYINQKFLNPDSLYFYPMPFEEFIFSWLLGFYLINSGIQFLMGKAINRQLQLFFIGLIIERTINWKFHPGFDTFFILFTMTPLAFSIIGFIYLKRFDYSIDNFSNILDKNEDFLN